MSLVATDLTPDGDERIVDKVIRMGAITHQVHGKAQRLRATRWGAPTSSLRAMSSTATFAVLRIKLQNDYRRPRFIETVPGKGYRFIPKFSNVGWQDTAH